MAECKVCGEWFSSNAKVDLCSGCERALDRLKGYVAPVVHGRWIKDSSGVVYCSECGEEHEWLDFRATYCDACGAKMDGREPYE